MNGFDFNITPPSNPWNSVRQVVRPLLKNGQIALLCVVMLGACLSLSLPFSLPVQVAVVLAGCFFLIRFTVNRAGRILIGILAAFLAMMSVTFVSLSDNALGILLFCSLYVALSAACAAGTILWNLGGVPLSLILAGCSYGIAFALTGSPLTALLALLPYPATFVMATATKADKPRVIVIVHGMLTLSVCFVIAAAVYLRVAVGSFDITAIRAAMDTVRDSILSRLLEQARLMFPAGDTLTQMETSLTAAVYQAFNMIPAMCVMLCMVSAFVGQMCAVSLLHLFGCKTLITPNARSFTLSPVTAIVFFIACLFTVFSSAQSMAYVVAMNLFTVLEIPLAFLGAINLLRMLKQAMAKGNPFVLILTVLVLITSCSCLLPILAMLGASEVLTAPMRRKMERMMKEMQDQQNGYSPEDTDHTKDEDDTSDDNDPRNGPHSGNTP